jgi:ribosome recycling factor
MDQNLKTELTDKMTKALAALDREFSGLRTGRASTHLLDSVIVDVYGSKMPISQVGTVSTPDAKTITVQVWDKSMVKTVEKAIADANLGVNPNADGQLIRMNLPPISEDRRKELVKIAHKCGESSKVTLRNIRRDGMDKLKQMEKSNDISKDEHHSHSEEIQKLTDEFIGKIETNVKSKEAEIIKI